MSQRGPAIAANLPCWCCKFILNMSGDLTQIHADVKQRDWIFTGNNMNLIIKMFIYKRQYLGFSAQTLMVRTGKHSDCTWQTQRFDTIQQPNVGILMHFTSRNTHKWVQIEAPWQMQLAHWKDMSERRLHIVYLYTIFTLPRILLGTGKRFAQCLCHWIDAHLCDWFPPLVLFSMINPLMG